MRLAICTKPLPDEYWTGYIMRLAVMNNYQSLEEFESKCMYGTRRVRRTSVCYPESLSLVCDRMAENRFFPSIQEAIAMTPYYTDINGLSEGKQAKLAESILFDINEPVTPNHKPQRKFQLRVCPQCMEQDIETYGFWYFHLKHHLSDVQVCSEHKEPLILLDSFDKRKYCMPNLEQGKKATICNMNDALFYAKMSESIYEHNKGVLVSKVCPSCGKEYLTHPYSEEIGAGCPFCRRNQAWDELIQQRLNLIYDNEYRLMGAFNEIATTEVQHIPCGISKQNLELLLWGKRGSCSGCKNMSVSKMQNKIDPDKKEYVIQRLYRKSNDSRAVRVTHLKCGNTFEIHPKLFLEKPHCIFCDKKQKAFWNSVVSKNYEIISDYQNNRDKVLFRHKDCGCTFLTSKTSFLAGRRCPICTNHYEFPMVSKAIAECGGEYKVIHGKKRGTITLYYEGDVIEQDISYAKVMNDLQSDEPMIFKNRIQKYYPPRSVRKRIYDTVLARTKEKGYWEAKDGIEGMAVVRGDRNILQDLTNQGYIQRMKKGRYKVYDDSYKCNDENTR